MLRVRPLTPEARLRRPSGGVLDEAKTRPGLIYLGYGLLNIGRNVPTPIERGRLERGCLWSPGGFDVSIQMQFSRQKELPPDLAEELILATKAFGLLGGLGGRSRRGFGSLSLTHLASDRHGDIWSPPADKDKYAAALHEILPNIGGRSASLPAFTAIGPQSRIDVVQKGANACALLDRLGWTMQRYRSWGRNGVVGGRPRETPPRFKPDHDWYVAWRSAGPRNLPQLAPPVRAVFGLPQPYTPTLRVTGPDDHGIEIDRRASPLFVHVHRLGRDYAVVLALLPAQFLPRNDVRIVYAGETAHPQSFNPNFDVILDFLDGAHRGGNDDGEPYFPESQTVWP